MGGAPRRPAGSAGHGRGHRSGEMLDAAKRLSEGVEPRPDFVQAPAEALPFDGVISTFGAMFAEDPSAAIAEMARVLRPGGRMALATWADEPECYIALIARWSDAPPPEASPFDWGRPDWLANALSGQFEIASRKQTTVLYPPDPATVWAEYVNGFGPVAATLDALPEDRRPQFRADFEDLHRPCETEIGLVIPRSALLVRGTRV